jgi:hypothetical protein
MNYVSGLDLGQTQDPTALAIVEQKDGPAIGRPGEMEPYFGVRHLHRWPLGTSYTAIVSDLKEMYSTPQLRGSALVVDQTGVGRPVVDMLVAANLPVLLCPYTITAGQNEGEGTVPKKDLVGAVQAALQTRRLEIAQSLELAQPLATELGHFRVKVTLKRNEVFESWRERDHDDLVLALAMAVWYGTIHGGGSCFSTDYTAELLPDYLR